MDSITMPGRISDVGNESRIALEQHGCSLPTICQGFVRCYKLCVRYVCGSSDFVLQLKPEMSHHPPPSRSNGNVWKMLLGSIDPWFSEIAIH